MNRIVRTVANIVGMSALSPLGSIREQTSTSPRFFTAQLNYKRLNKYTSMPLKCSNLFSPSVSLTGTVRDRCCIWFPACRFDCEFEERRRRPGPEQSLKFTSYPYDQCCKNSKIFAGLVWRYVVKPVLLYAIPGGS